jgi:pimeloyl-ACP methyl ester carboxylesterase
MANQMTVVLVHGAWADGSSWAQVIESLAHAGIKSIAAPLPLTSLEDDAKALTRSLARIEGQVLLVAHAYGGAVIGAIESDKVAGLVYIAALAPDEGETVADVFYRAPPHALAPKLAPDADGWIWLPEDAFAAAFAQNASVRSLQVLAAVQRPIAPPCITVPVGRPLWKSKPSWFLIAEDDRMIPKDTQVFMAHRMGATPRLAAVDHTPSVSAPDEVTGVIVGALRSL